jgi:polyisoprenyl-phosphate glycosyltransferase
VKPQFSIILPCYNEAENIPILLERFRQFTGSVNFELILVNNGSSDLSSQILFKALQDQRNSFLKVVSIEKNIGYGHGIQAGLESAKGDFLAYSHADIQTPPEDLFKAFDMIKSGKADINNTLIKGFRINRSDNKTFLTQGLSRVVRFLLGVSMVDINGQPKVFSRQFFESFEAPPTDFSYDVFVMYWASHNGLKLKTFDVDFGERLHGQSKWSSGILSRYKTILRYLNSIVKLSWCNRSVGNNPLGHLLRFLTTGIFTNIINFGVFWLLLRLLTVNYLISSIAGFFAGFILGFFLNRRFTFRVESGRVGNQMVKFLIISLISLGANIGSIYICVEWFHIIPEISQIIAILVSTAINFSGSKFWVFGQEKNVIKPA